MAPQTDRRFDSVIDYQYLLAGRRQAEAAGLAAFEHPVTSDEIIGLNRRQYQYAQTRLQRYYAMVTESHLWYIGRHDLRIDAQSRRFVRIDQANKIPRPVINLILEKVESVTGDLNKGVIVGKVRPNSNDMRDILAARAADDIRRFKWDEDEMDEFQRMLVQGAVIGGDMFGFTEVDKNANEMVEIDIPRPDGTNFTAKIGLGDVKTWLLSALQIFANPGATGVTPKKSRWLHIHVLQPEEFVKESFSHAADEITGDLQGNPIASWQHKLQQMMLEETSTSGGGLLYGSSATADMEIEKQVVVHQIIFHPSKYYPDGRLFIVAGNAVCYAGKKPEEMAVDQYRYSPVENSMWSLGLVNPLISLNRHMESAVAQNTLSRKVAAMPIWLVPSRAGGALWEGELKMKPGLIAKYRSNQYKEKPELVQGHHPADAGYVADMQMFMQEFFERVSGAKQVLVGERPEGISAGIALRQLIQRASVRFAPKLTALMKAIENIESHRLRAIATSPRWQIPTTVSLPGRAGRRSWRMAQASDMRDNYNYRIEAEAKTITDEVSIAQSTLDALNAQLINIMDPVLGPRNRFNALEKIGLGEAGFEDTNMIDYRHAQRVLAMLEEGDDYQIGPYDNYQIHFITTLDFIKQEQFDTLSPHIQTRIMAHLQELQQRVKMQSLGMMFKEADNDMMAEQVAGGEPEPPMLPPGQEQQGPVGAPGMPQGPSAPTGAPQPQPVAA